MPDSVCFMEINVQGTVRGVGFRPFVYNLAREFDITGTVSNNGQGVVIEAQGVRTSIEAFVRDLRTNAPPLARITSLRDNCSRTKGIFKEFSILASSSGQESCALIPADIAICGNCLDDILAPGNRRYSYSFTNCTNCGPRFTIVQFTPYDRAATSMKHFQLCEDCQAEYNDPQDRRFHAQPNGCPACGPELSFHDGEGQYLETASPLAELASSLRMGQVAAVRGLGGFYLVVDAESEEAVSRLRNRKGRKSKPLTVMTKNLQEAMRVSYVSTMAAE